MEKLLEKLSLCVERGKLKKGSPYPKDMKDEDGVVELTNELLEAGMPAQEILNNGLMKGMKNIGDKYGAGKAFIPDMLVAAKAMNTATEILRPYFVSESEEEKGKLIIGTVAGDLHDIGKNLVKMIVEGAGWNVIDLGTDVSTEKFLDALEKNPGAAVGMSALLTTTMQRMETNVQAIRAKFPGTKIIIGGAPVTESFKNKIGADAYFPTPHKVPSYLQALL